MSKSKLLRTLLTRLDEVNPLLRFGAGAGTGALANNAYINQVNPDISAEGRARSNLTSGVLAGAMSRRGALKGLVSDKRIPVPGLKHIPLPSKSTILPATLLAARQGLLLPDTVHGHPYGFGDTGFDPARSPIRKNITEFKKPEVTKALAEAAPHPIKSLAAFFTRQNIDQTVAALKNDAYRESAALHVKNTTLPKIYATMIETMGGVPNVKKNPAGVPFTDKEGKPIYTSTASDLGAAAAPHLIGGAGGAFLGYQLADTLGNYAFPDQASKTYEERRRQEDRRGWMKFLGGNLGAIGGVGLAAAATPHLNAAAGKFMAPAKPVVKAASGKILQKAVNAAKNMFTDTAIGAGITAGQYGLGLVPITQADTGSNLLQPYIPADPNASDAYRTIANNKDTAQLLTGWNAALLAPTLRRMATGRRGFKPRANMNFAQRMLTPKNTLARASLLSGAAAGGPAFADVTRAVPNFVEVLKPVVSDSAKDDMMNPLASAVAGAQEEFTQQSPRLQETLAETLPEIAGKAGVPGFGETGKKNLNSMLSAATLSSGLQLAGGGVGAIAGMTGGNWLSDILLQAGVKNKLFKDRPKLFKMLRTLGGLGGGALGAYAGLKGMDRAAPAIADWYKNKLESTTPPPTQA
jgi:hypothetical protein